MARYSTAGYHACQISFGIATPPAAAIAVLVIGASDPALDLTPAGLPGCVLRASLDVLLPMAYGVPWCGPSVPPSACTGSLAQWVALPADPALAGSTVYFQAFGFSTGWPAPAGPMLSNGVSLGLF